MKNRASPERSRGGFTIVEMMIAVTILGIITTVGSNLFFTVLRGSTKAKVLQMVKQNGDYALSVMEDMIRNARKIKSYSVTSLVIVNPDGGETTFSCSSGRIASSSSSLMTDEVRVFDCANPVFFTVTEGLDGVRPALVAIQFKLTQAGTSTRPEEQALVDFRTTVGLRNY